MMRNLYLAPLLIPAVILSACGGSDDTPAPTTEPAVGIVNIAISDAPMNQVSKVELVLDKLIMTDKDGTVHQHDMGQHRFNLLDFQGMESHEVINALELPAGHYHDVHFTLINGDQSDGCAIENSQGRLPLMVENNRLPLDDFMLNEHENLFLTMEIDLYQSMHLNDDQYHLNHYGIYSVDNKKMGHLIGEMDPQWIADCETTHSDKAPIGGQFYHMAYLYQNNVTNLTQMADMSSTRNDGKFSPVAVAPIHQDMNGDWSFAMGYLPAGDYHIAYTCLSHLDDPVTDDISQGTFSLFQDAGSVTIENDGQETTHQCGNGHGNHGGRR